MTTGQARQLTRLTTQPQGASFSPDGKRIVFFNVDGMWRVAQMSVLDVATGSGHQDPRHAPAAGHADLVARWHRASRSPAWRRSAPGSAKAPTRF